MLRLPYVRFAGINWHVTTPNARGLTVRLKKSNWIRNFTRSAMVVVLASEESMFQRGIPRKRRTLATARIGVTSTVAEGTAAPLGSLTVPKMER